MKNQLLQLVNLTKLHLLQTYGLKTRKQTAPLPPQIKTEYKPQPKQVLVEQPKPVEKTAIKEQKVVAPVQQARVDAPVDLSEIRKLVTQTLPELVILDKIPSDQEAKRLSNSWNDRSEKVVHIVLPEATADQLQVFQNLQKAIVDMLKIKAVIVHNCSEYQPGIFCIGRRQDLESINKKYCTYLEDDLNRYLSEPKLKSILWNGLKESLRGH